jgi:hypothetical protein
MATFLTTVNNVLKRLREDTVASVTTTTYSTLIGQFVNDALREVNDAWDWTVLRQIVNVTTANGTYSYSLTGAGERSRMLTDNYSGNPAVYNTTNDYRLTLVESADINRFRGLGSSSNAQPTYFAYEGEDGSNDPTVIMYPTPNAAYNIEFNLIIPQDDLSADGDIITVPSKAVEMRAWAYAIAERGEEGGISFNDADQVARLALSDAITFDAQKLGMGTTWRVV